MLQQSGEPQVVLNLQLDVVKTQPVSATNVCVEREALR
jgi:hypothetical protein